MTRLRTKFLPRPWWQQALLIAIAAIVYIYTVGFVFGARVLPSLIGWSNGIPRLTDAAPGDVPALFARWDSGYYLHIAENGYSPNGDERAFFPLYPIVVHAVSAVWGIPLLWSGALVSVLSFISAGLLLYQWVRTDYTHAQALLATLLMYFSPMAFFFVAFYGEPLLLLTGVASLYFARRGQFLMSGIAIALAGASRPTAFLLGLPYVIEFWQQRNFTRRQWLQFALGAAIAPLGTLAYLAFLTQQIHASSLLAASVAVEWDEWKRYTAWPWQVLFDGLNAAIFGAGITGDWFSRLLAWHDLSYAVFALVIGIRNFTRLRLSAAMFLLAGMLFFYTMHGPYGYAFWSIPRYITALFPIYLALALDLGRLPVQYLWLAIGASTLLLGMLASWFVSGRWVA